jgi:hypothetical protein
MLNLFILLIILLASSQTTTPLKTIWDLSKALSFYLSKFHISLNYKANLKISLLSDNLMMKNFIFVSSRDHKKLLLNY